MKQDRISKRITGIPIWRSQYRRGLASGLNQRGQAVVEYILLLVIAVSIILAFRGAFQSMNSFMSDSMGKYVICLMEYGELPALGVQEDDLKNHKVGTGRKCSMGQISATVAAVSGTSTGGAGARGGSASGSNSSESSSGDRRSSTANASGRDSSTSSSRGSAGDRGSAGRSGVSSRTVGSDGYATADGPGSATNSKVKVIDEDDQRRGRALSDTAYQSSSSNFSYSKDKYRAITGKMAEEIEKKTKSSSRKPSSRVTSVSEEGYRFLPYKKTFKPPTVDKPSQEKPESEFGFGQFMKWIIIAGILVICFILFGGQILNYSNSGEK